MTELLLTTKNIVAQYKEYSNKDKYIEMLILMRNNRFLSDSKYNKAMTEIQKLVRGE